MIRLLLLAALGAALGGILFTLGYLLGYLPKPPWWAVYGSAALAPALTILCWSGTHERN